MRRKRLTIAGIGALVVAAVTLVLLWPRDVPEPGKPGAAAVFDDPAAWRDVRWERIDPPSMGGQLTQSPVRIIRGGPGFIVLGRDAMGGEGREDTVAAIWTSNDGRDWAKHRLTEGVPPGDVAEIRLIAAGAPGIVVAGGVCCTVEDPAMWWSADGASWERITLPPDMQDVAFYDVEAGPGGFVVAGVSLVGNPNDPDEVAELWTSPDGRSWSEVDPEAAGLGPGHVSDVTWTGDAWVAVGKQPGGETWDGAVWRSADGVAWDRIAVDDPSITGPEEEELGRVFALEHGLVALGGAGTHADRQDCEGLLRGEGQRGPDIVGVADASLALSCGWLGEARWTSEDGSTWERAPDAPPDVGGRRLIEQRVIATGGPGLVVVGAEEPRRVVLGDHIGTWVSADGLTWGPVGLSPQFPDGLILADIVVVGRTIVGIGDSEWDQPTGSDGVVWIGTVSP